LTLTAAFLTLWLGHRWLKVPLGVLGGVLGGLQTQPAVLAFALEKTGNDQPNLGYATVYPVAMLLKIIDPPLNGQAQGANPLGGPRRAQYRRIWSSRKEACRPSGRRKP